DAEREKAIDAGHDLSQILTTDDLVNSEHCYFVATGVTDGDMLRGVSYRNRSAVTRSLVMRSKSGTIRFLESQHQLGKLQEYSVLDEIQSERQALPHSHGNRRANRVTQRSVECCVAWGAPKASLPRWGAR